MGKKSKLQLSREETEKALKETNRKIEQLGLSAADFYVKLNCLQIQFDAIRNVPNDKKIKYEKIKQERLVWKQQANKIEKDYVEAICKEVKDGAAVAGAGVAVAVMGPTVAMGIATTFGVASTGTAIATLSGAAATNAALAWIGGGALVAGGGGMALGNFVLTLAGPVGWAIAGAALLSSGLLFWKTKSEKQRMESIFILISERDKKRYELAIVELNERIKRIKEEGDMLEKAMYTIQSFGSDYNSMTEKQQYELGSFVNLMESSTQLLINPIEGLLPKCTEDDFNNYYSDPQTKEASMYKKEAIICLANLLYKIDLDDKDKKILVALFKKNKEFLESIKLTAKQFNVQIIDDVESLLLNI